MFVQAQALTLARAVGLRQVEADALRNLGNVSWGQDDPAGARPYLEQVLAIHREMGNRFLNTADGHSATSAAKLKHILQETNGI